MRQTHEREDGLDDREKEVSSNSVRSQALCCYYFREGAGKSGDTHTEREEHLGEDKHKRRERGRALCMSDWFVCVLFFAS